MTEPLPPGSPEDLPGDEGSVYEVPQDEIKGLLEQMARAIDKNLPDGWGFALQFVNYDVGEGTTPRAIFYISNMERKSMIASLQEFIRTQKERGH